MPEVRREYKSVSTLMDADEAINYPTELLNSLETAGFARHTLKSKIGAVTLCSKELNSSTLCNATKLRAKWLDNF
jgi:hypothetical protein